MNTADELFPKFKIETKFAFIPTVVTILTHSMSNGGLKGVFSKVWLRDYFWITERNATLAGYFYERITPNFKERKDAEYYLKMRLDYILKQP